MSDVTVTRAPERKYPQPTGIARFETGTLFESTLPIGSMTNVFIRTNDGAVRLNDARHYLLAEFVLGVYKELTQGSTILLKQA